MSQWQDISTAPEGRCLLWVADGGMTKDEPGIASFGTVYRYDDGEMNARPDGYHGKWKVTHWMPIPPAPGATP